MAKEKTLTVFKIGDRVQVAYNPRTNYSLRLTGLGRRGSIVSMDVFTVGVLLDGDKLPTLYAYRHVRAIKEQPIREVVMSALMEILGQ